MIGLALLAAGPAPPPMCPAGHRALLHFSCPATLCCLPPSLKTLLAAAASSSCCRRWLLPLLTPGSCPSLLLPFPDCPSHSCTPSPGLLLQELDSMCSEKGQCQLVADKGHCQLCGTSAMDLPAPCCLCSSSAMDMPADREVGQGLQGGCSLAAGSCLWAAAVAMAESRPGTLGGALARCARQGGLGHRHMVCSWPCPPSGRRRTLPATGWASWEQACRQGPGERGAGRQQVPMTRPCTRPGPTRLLHPVVVLI